MSSFLYNPYYVLPLAAIRIPIEIIVVTIESINITFIISIASQNAFRTSVTDLSPNTSDMIDDNDRKNLQNTTSIIAGKNTSTTAIIPTTPTLERISDE